MKDKNHTVFSIDAENVFNKVNKVDYKSNIDL